MTVLIPIAIVIILIVVWALLVSVGWRVLWISYNHDDPEMPEKRL